MRKMTAQQLANYLINNDWEIQIIHHQYDLIDEMVQGDELDADFDTIVEAIEIANEDPYIIGLANDGN